METMKMLYGPEIVQHWPVIYDVLRPSVETSEYSEGELLKRLVTSKAQLWSGYDPEDTNKGIFLVTEIQPRDSGLVIVIRFLGGRDLEAWVPLLDHLLFQWALAEGAIRIEIWGRRGLARITATRGYREEYTVFSLDMPRPQVH